MNKIKKFILTKQKEKQYKNAIHDHKINILRAMYEMMNCEALKDIMSDADILLPLWYNVLEHDDSKYDKEEFNAYRKHYFPIDEQEKQLNEENFKQAVNNHYMNNIHHWQARQDWSNNELDIKTKVACLENVIDWLARGYEFNNRPCDYYEKIKNKIKLPQIQIEFIEKIIYEGIDKK